MAGGARVSVELRGRGIVPGVVEAEALVTHDPISGFGGIDVATGTVIEPRHELFGVCFTGKVLVFPGAKGSSGWSGFFQSTRLMGTAPAAMVFNIVTTKAVLGAIVTRIPTVVEAAPDPLDVIRTGDLIRVDGDTGIVSVVRRATLAPVLSADFIQ
jgi:predicted aconitase with swiveling domain